MTGLIKDARTSKTVFSKILKKGDSFVTSNTEEVFTVIEDTAYHSTGVKVYDHSDQSVGEIGLYCIVTQVLLETVIKDLL